jgi:hypothetical protein
MRPNCGFTDLESTHADEMHAAEECSQQNQKAAPFRKPLERGESGGRFSGKSMQGIVLRGRTQEKSRFMEESKAHLAIASLVALIRALDEPKDSKPLLGLHR